MQNTRNDEMARVLADYFAFNKLARNVLNECGSKERARPRPWTDVFSDGLVL